METLKFVMTNSTPPFSVGGDAYHVHLLSTELAKKGHEVHIVSSMDSYELMAKLYNLSVKKYEETMLNEKGIFLHPLSSPLKKLDPILTYSFGNSRFYYNKYQELLKQIQPDIVHHHDVTFLGYNFFKKQRNYTQLYTAHNYWLICPNRELFRFGKVCDNPSLCSLCLLYSRRTPQVWRWVTSIEKITKDIDIIIAPSEFIKQKLEDKLNKKIIYLPNFIPSPEKEIKPSGYENYFLYVGQLEKRKGIMKLLNTFKNYAREINANLIIVSSGSLGLKIEDFIKKNKMENKVLLLGRVDKKQLWSLYNDALALVVPSIWPENNPLVALEAMSVGTPVIGTNAGGLGEIIGKVDENLIFNGDELEEIKMILENKTLYSKERIKKVYNQWYSPEVYLNGYKQLYQ
jgi:glycosyltransferase involved in cell wall biosynthesis